MDKEFVPYDVAEALRGLGMSKPCHYFWAEHPSDSAPFLLASSERTSIRSWTFLCPAPTYRQAFTFMRVGWGFYPLILIDTKIPGWEASVLTAKGSDWFDNVYREYHEAELGCLRSMIYLAKPVRKVNGGDGADLCPTCRKIISEPNTCDCRAIIQQPVQ
jgi:hypothetical protein